MTTSETQTPVHAPKPRRPAPWLISLGRSLIGILGVWWLLLGLVAWLGNSTVGMLSPDHAQGEGLVLALLGVGTMAVSYLAGSLRRSMVALAGVVVLVALIVLVLHVSFLNIVDLIVAIGGAVALVARPDNLAAGPRPWREVPATPIANVFRRIDRVRGTGWLNCPKCHEHAAQDVVDQLWFVAVLFYRLTPVRRRRVLLCRRCGYVRPATPEEMQRLDTAGERIRPAVLFPVGIVGIGVMVVLVLLVAASAVATGAAALTFGQDSGRDVAPITWDVPTSWNYDVTDKPDPGSAANVDVHTTDESFVLARYPVENNALEIYQNHFGDPYSSFQDVGEPQAPPKPTNATVAGEKALSYTATFTHSEAASKVTFYAFVHDGVGYSLYFEATAPAQIKEMFDSGGVMDRVLKTFSFRSGAKETPGACATPAPTPAPGAPAASPSASATSSASALPTCAPPPSPLAGASGSPSAGASPSASASP